jgi:hypothetical protein
MKKSRFPRAARTVAAVSFVASAAVPRAAAADVADAAEAERLFEEGRERMLEGRFDEACPKLAESQRLDPHVGTLLNLAACHERQGKVASAWVEYQKALTAARADGQAERARLAEQRIATLEPRVPWLRIRVLQRLAPDAVTLDGSVLPPAAWDSALPVDPGFHVVEARGRGKLAFDERFELGEGSRRTVTIDLEPPDDGAASTPPPERLVVGPSSAPEAAPARPSSRSRWVFAPGIFVGYLGVHNPRTSSNDLIELRDHTAPGESTTTCSSDCDYELNSKGAPSAGLSLFAGYAFSEDVTAGLRLLAGPRLAGGGGYFATFGPSVSFRANEKLSVGAFAFFGTAELAGYGDVRAPPGHSVLSPGPHRLQGDLGGGMGVGVELSWTIAELARGSIVASALPLFLAGSQGTAIAVPLALSYRFQ